MLAGLLIISLLTVPASQHTRVAFGGKNKRDKISEQETAGWIQSQESQDMKCGLPAKGSNPNLEDTKTPTNR